MHPVPSDGVEYCGQILGDGLRVVTRCGSIAVTEAPQVHRGDAQPVGAKQIGHSPPDRPGVWESVHQEHGVTGSRRLDREPGIADAHRLRDTSGEVGRQITHTPNQPSDLPIRH